MDLVPLQYHEVLITKKMTNDIRQWLNNRGITDEVIAKSKIDSDQTGRVVIPIFDKSGNVIFNKYRRNPASDDGPKYIYSKGSHAALYGISNIDLSKEIIICEGELDCLVLQSKGFYAISSTGGANTFKEEWAALLIEKDVYVFLDNDNAGRQGIIKICRLLPHAKQMIISVGSKVDITDFFNSGKTADDFRGFMRFAEPIPAELLEDPKPVHRSKKAITDNRLESAKQVPLTTLLKFNRQGFANCPIHNEKTPSLKMFKDNKWRCFGCGEHGDSIDLIMKIQNLKLTEAIDYLIGPQQNVNNT